MLDLDKHISMSEENIKSPDLTGKFSAKDLDAIGNYVWQGYDKDKRSRTKWEKRNESAMNLALQHSEPKNFPWQNCSNVAFPLVTIGAMQFHSRAYPALIPDNMPVKCRVIGPDPKGELKIRADRIANHMSYQCMEQDINWEDQHDKMLLNVAIMGCAFIKSYYSATMGHNISEFVMARDLYIDYFAKSVETANRKTHRFTMTRNEIYERVMRGMYRNILKEDWYVAPPTKPKEYSQSKKDDREGTDAPLPDMFTPFSILEQHTYLDLDGDGYSEPYIVTIEESSRKVLRIVARFTESSVERNNRGKIIRINAEEYFTKFPFIPSHDGSIYDIGFGVFLGPLNESVNSLINQLVDAGTISNTAGGFLGRGAKIMGGEYTFSPFSWKTIPSTGDDIKKNIFPLPVREPSTVLLQLLNLLITYTSRISATTETMVGENPGQNTPAQTTQTMVEQGMKIYTAIYKRIWRAMKEEFKKLYLLNAQNMPYKDYIGGSNMFALKADYVEGMVDIVPAADPHMTSDIVKLQRAIALKQIATTTPGYNRPLIERELLKAMKVDAIDAIYPGEGKVPNPPLNPRVMLEQVKAQSKQQTAQIHMQEMVIKIHAEQGKVQAEIEKLQAETAQILSTVGAAQAEHQLEIFKTKIEYLKARDESMRGYLDLLMQGQQNAQQGGVSGMEGQSANQGSPQVS